MVQGRRLEEGAPEPGKDTGSGQVTCHFLLHTSHDLKASLRAIRVHAELFAKEWDAGETANLAQHSDAIVLHTAKLESLANGLAEYSIACQIEQDSFVLTPLEVIVRTQLARMASEIQQSGAVITYDKLPRIRCEPDGIGKLFENLLRNALLHRQGDAPRIHVSAEEQGDRWLFGVRDNGPGIEPGYLERIFEPFERLRGQQAAGPGLGLAVCRQIVERHGGKIWAESQFGAGVSIFFTLPSDGGA
jgi:light-regulated signal transduction histidine kinase (bacteriophytochrome)